MSFKHLGYKFLGGCSLVKKLIYASIAFKKLFRTDNWYLDID